MPTLKTRYGGFLTGVEWQITQVVDDTLDWNHTGHTATGNAASQSSLPHVLTKLQCSGVWQQQ